MLMREYDISLLFFFFSSRRRHTRLQGDWSSDVCSSDLIGRVAILTAPHGGRAACHYCGPCERGCITHSYFNSIGVTLPAARATGRVTLGAYSVVRGVLFDAPRGPAARVRVNRAQHHPAPPVRATRD